MVQRANKADSQIGKLQGRNPEFLEGVTSANGGIGAPSAGLDLR